MTLKIELQNDQEATVLIEMINVAVKATGLQGAEAGLYFKKKIESALQEAKTPETPKE